MAPVCYAADASRRREPVVAGLTSSVPRRWEMMLPMRFLFVGDSMTVGRAGDFTWRHRMWQHLETTLGPGAYTITGPRTGLYAGDGADASEAYADPAFPPAARRHLAGWGEGWRHMAPLIQPVVATTRADVLLVALGLIDLGFYAHAEETAEHARTFLSRARAAKPDVRAVILPVVPNVRARTDPFFADDCARFNTLLAKTVAELDRPGSPLLLASHPPGYTLDADTYDGTHPGPSGEHRIAAAFADALHQGWGVGGPYRSLSE